MLQPTCKPGSVLSRKKASAIYLGLSLPAGSSGLPSGIGRATLLAPVYTTLQPIRRTAFRIPAEPVGSYPAFSPLPENRRLFSVTLLCPCGQLPVKKYGALRCPDFPPAGFPASGRPVCCNDTKVMKNCAYLLAFLPEKVPVTA